MPIMNACVKDDRMIDEHECKACNRVCRHAGEQTTAERLERAVPKKTPVAGEILVSIKIKESPEFAQLKNTLAVISESLAIASELIEKIKVGVEVEDYNP